MPWNRTLDTRQEHTVARLYCPGCGDWLVPAAAFEQADDGSGGGDVVCLGCATTYPWRDGVLWLGEGRGQLSRWFRLGAEDISFLGMLEQMLRIARNSDRTFEDETYALLSWLDPAPGQHVLVVGCDDGRAIPPLAEAVYPGLVIAVDSDLTLLQRARRACGAARATNVVLVQADLVHPPVRPGTFDRLLLLGVLHGKDRPDTYIDRVARALVPDGVIAGVTLAQSILPQIAEQQKQFSAGAGVHFTDLNALGKDLCRGEFDRFQMDQASNWMARFVVHRASRTLAAGQVSGCFKALRADR